MGSARSADWAALRELRRKKRVAAGRVWRRGRVRRRERAACRRNRRRRVLTRVHRVLLSLFPSRDGGYEFGSNFLERRSELGLLVGGGVRRRAAARLQGGQRVEVRAFHAGHLRLGVVRASFRILQPFHERFIRGGD